MLDVRVRVRVAGACMGALIVRFGIRTKSVCLPDFLRLYFFICEGGTVRGGSYT